MKNVQIISDIITVNAFMPEENSGFGNILKFFGKNGSTKLRLEGDQIL